MKNAMDAAVVFGSALVLFYAFAWAQPHYTVTDLGALWPSAVIDGPVVFGTLNGEPVRWQNGQVRVLQHYGEGGRVNGANRYGEAVGSVLRGGKTLPAFWYANGQLVGLPISGEGEAHGLNANRVIAGRNITDRHALRWRPESLEEYLGRGQASGVDGAGRAWGTWGITPSVQLLMWDTTGAEHLINPIGSAIGRSVNESGVVAVEYEAPIGEVYAARATFEGGIVPLPRLPGVMGCYGSRINRQGDVLGLCQNFPYSNSHATLWPASGGVIDLNTRVSLDGWVLGAPFGISDSGHIVVGANNHNGSAFPFQRALLLSPQAEPPALALRTNGNPFSVGETMHATVERQGTSDLHVAVIMPDGTTTLFFTSLESLSYVVGTIPSGPYPITAGQSLTHTWTGLEPSGVYHIVAAIARPGSLADGRIDAGDILALDWKAVHFEPRVAQR